MLEQTFKNIDNTLYKGVGRKLDNSDYQIQVEDDKHNEFIMFLIKQALKY